MVRPLMDRSLQKSDQTALLLPIIPDLLQVNKLLRNHMRLHPSVAAKQTSKSNRLHPYWKPVS